MCGVLCCRSSRRSVSSPLDVTLLAASPELAAKTRMTRAQSKVDLSSFDVERKVGEGQFGEVTLVTWGEEGWGI